MKCNSIHKFDDIGNAQTFVDAIIKAGFKQVAYGKDGGVFYSNGLHTLFIYVSRLRGMATK